jgi:predicted TIM-barrel fold metal-dependent hydrolase
MERMIKKHGSERVLFGTDSPWKRADDEIKRICALNLPQSDIDNILYKNALAIIG